MKQIIETLTRKRIFHVEQYAVLLPGYLCKYSISFYQRWLRSYIQIY